MLLRQMQVAVFYPDISIEHSSRCSWRFRGTYTCFESICRHLLVRDDSRSSGPGKAPGKSEGDYGSDIEKMLAPFAALI